MSPYHSPAFPSPSHSPSAPTRTNSIPFRSLITSPARPHVFPPTKTPGSYSPTPARSGIQSHDPPPWDPETSPCPCRALRTATPFRVPEDHRARPPCGRVRRPSPPSPRLRHSVARRGGRGGGGGEEASAVQRVGRMGRRTHKAQPPLNP